MFVKRLFVAFAFLFLFTSKGLAFDIPEPEGFVTDQTGTLSYEDEMALELKIQEVEESTTAEIGIFIVSTTGEEDIAELAFEVGNSWGVGKAQNDNGLLILVAIDDRAWFMATGYGLEGTLPDAITKRIAERDFPPYFREGDYAGGLMAALVDIQGYLENDPTVMADLTPSTSDFDDSLPFWFIVVIVVAIAKTIWVGASKKKKRMLRFAIGNVFLLGLGLLTITLVPAVVVTAVSALIDLAVMSGPSSGGGRSGSSRSRSNWWSSSGSSSSSWGSSSGGGSFGGGSFGGGGSGGRW